MPVDLPNARRNDGKSTAQSPIPLIIIAVVLGIGVSSISAMAPKGYAWAALTAPFR